MGQWIGELEELPKAVESELLGRDCGFDSALICEEQSAVNWPGVAKSRSFRDLERTS